MMQTGLHYELCKARTTLRRDIVYETDFRNFREVLPIREIKSTRKKVFYPFFRICKSSIFKLGSLSINDGYVQNILQDIKQCK